MAHRGGIVCVRNHFDLFVSVLQDFREVTFEGGEQEVAETIPLGKPCSLYDWTVFLDTVVNPCSVLLQEGLEER